jgi:hypothetical protein
MTHESDAGRADAGGSGAGGSGAVRSWWDESRGIIAFFIAPLAAPLVVYLVAQADNSPTTLFVGIALTVSYIGTVAFGLPLYRLLQKERLTHFGLAALGGFVIGLATMYLVDALFMAGLGHGPAYIAAQLGRSDVFTWDVRFGGLSGLAVGVVLWLIARPDRQPQ